MITGMCGCCIGRCLMLPILGPSLITGGASLLGSFLNSTTSAANTAEQLQAQEQMQLQTEQFNAQQVQQQEQFQAGQAQTQRDYETTMSNSAYQRASADMQKAGLNPMMMFGSGSAASTPSVSAPSGAAASVGTPSVPMSQRQNPFGGIGQAVASAVDAGIKGEYYKKMEQEIAASQVEADKSKAVTDNLKQTHDINQPAARDSMIRMGYPDWLANTLVYGGDISKGVGAAGDAIWNMLPTSLFKSGAKMASGRWGNPGSSTPVASAPTEASSSSANAVRRGMDIERQMQEGATKYEWKPDWGAMNKFMRESGQLGGRNPGTGGSYD